MSARTKSTVVAVLVALLAVGTWLIADGSGSDDTAGPASSTPSVRASGSGSGSGSGSASASSSPSGVSGLPTVDEADLPSQAVTTLRLIDRGGPFPYPDKDGSTFGNFEGLLPPEPRGYYAEYTVPTPGESDRGPRRIIAGDGGELYWTADHYASFEEILRASSG